MEAHWRLKMPRNQKDANLGTRTSRLSKLKPRKAPYWSSLGVGLQLGYFRPAKGAGTWRARFYDTDTRHRIQTALGTADDYADADGFLSFSFAQAQAKAQDWFAVAHHKSTGEVVQRGAFTVAHAWEAYRRDCERREFAARYRWGRASDECASAREADGLVRTA